MKPDHHHSLRNNGHSEHWYSLVLGDGMTSAMPSDEIEESFRRSFIAAGEPADMAVFTRSETERRLHCEVTAYFSPAAADIAKAFDAQPCGKPSRSGLSLLAGVQNSWLVLFPQIENRSDMENKVNR